MECAGLKAAIVEGLAGVDGFEPLAVGSMLPGESVATTVSRSSANATAPAPSRWCARCDRSAYDEVIAGGQYCFQQRLADLLAQDRDHRKGELGRQVVPIRRPGPGLVPASSSPSRHATRNGSQRRGINEVTVMLPR